MFLDIYVGIGFVIKLYYFIQKNYSIESFTHIEYMKKYIKQDEWMQHVGYFVENLFMKFQLKLFPGL